MPAARENDMATPLHPLFGSRAGQGLHLFLVDLDLAGFLHLIAQVGYKESEDLLLLALEELVTNLVALARVIGVGRLLRLCYREHRRVRSAIDRTTDVPGLHVECDRSLARHRTDVWNLAIRKHQVAGLHGCAQFLRGSLQVMLSLGAIG